MNDLYRLDTNSNRPNTDLVADLVAATEKGAVRWRVDYAFGHDYSACVSDDYGTLLLLLSRRKLTATNGEKTRWAFRSGLTKLHDAAGRQASAP